MIFVTPFTDSDNNVFDNETIYFPFPFYKDEINTFPRQLGRKLQEK